MKYAFLGIIPLVIPSVLIDIPIPTDRIPVQKGKDLAYIRSLADEVGYVFYVEPGPEPGTSVAYWGPEIKVGEPQKALSINMDAATNIESVSCSFNSQGKVLPIVYIQNQQTHVPIPIPIPDITPLNPPLGLIPPIPLNIEPINESANYSPIRAAVIGLTKAARSAEAVTATGSSECCALRPTAKGAASRRSARGRGSVRRPLLRQERDEHDQARRVQTKFHSHTQRSHLHVFESPGMSDKKFFGKYRGTVLNNIDPMMMGRIQAIVPDVTGLIPSSWCMPCFQVAGIQNGVFTVPIVGSAVWIEYEHGDPDYPIWTGCFYGTAAEVPAVALIVPPGVPGITLQTPLQNSLTISDVPGPTGGILIKTTTGAMISVSDTGIIISNGKGAIINMVGPSTDINASALTII